MSSPLPENLADWPRDPYALLGVAPHTPPKEIRKAYTRLIRQYKPEQYPEQFRRIREAFEQVERWSSYLPPPPEPGTEELASPLVFETRTHTADAELRQLWEQACAGEEQTAYHRYRELAAQPGCPAEVWPRLYWLLRLNPALDRELEACDWLVRGLRASSGVGACVELYRRVLVQQPAEALSPRFTTLLEAPVALYTLTSWLGWRWQAAFELAQAPIIIGDLEAYRARYLGGADPQAWVAVLFTAFERLAWLESKQASVAAQACKAELERLVGLQQAHSLDRLDQLQELVQTWRNACGGKPSPLLALVPASWNQPAVVVRLPLQQALLHLLGDSARAWSACNILQTTAPLVLAELTRLLEELHYEMALTATATIEPAALQTLAELFVREQASSDSHPPRLPFLDFCLVHRLLPREALAAMRAVPRCPAVWDALENDASLYFLCLAQRWLSS